MSSVVGKFTKKTFELLGKHVDVYVADIDGIISFQNLTILDSYSGPTTFDHTVIDYGDFFVKYIKRRETVDDVSTYLHENRWFHQVGDYNQTNEAMKTISEIANTPLAVVRDEKLDVLYRELMAGLCTELGKHVYSSEGAHELVIVPLRGGLLVASLLPGFDLRKVIPIDCKRIPMKDYLGHFSFGMSFRYFSEGTKKVLNKKYTSKKESIQILEVAVGSGITTVGMMLDMYARNMLPKTISVVAPVVTLPGVKLVKAVADILGVRLEIYTSKCYPSLGDFYNDRNDSVVDYQGDYVIGNASNILEPFLHLNDLDDFYVGSYGRENK